MVRTTIALLALLTFSVLYGCEQEDSPVERTDNEAENTAKDSQSVQTEKEPTTPGTTAIDEPTTIAGLAAMRVVEVTEKQGLSCEGPDPRRGEGIEGEVQWMCSGEEGNILYEVYIVAREDTRGVRGVQASVLDNNASNNDPVAAAFLSEIASVPYQGANPEEAQRWISNNISEAGAERSIGSAAFYLVGSAEEADEPYTIYTLDMVGE